MLVCQNLNKVYSEGTVRECRAINSMTFSMKSGDFVVLFGENGSGKTTFFDLISGNQFATSGEIMLNDEDVTKLPPHKRSKYVTRIFQSRDAGLPQSMMVEEVLKMAVGTESSEHCIELLQEHLGDIRGDFFKLAKEQMWSLSGGEHQLVSLVVAVILAQKSRSTNHLLLLDEHVSTLDPIAHDIVLEKTSKMISDFGLSAIMTTHNIEVAINYGNRQTMMGRGRIVEDLTGDKRVLNREEFLRLVVEKRAV